MQTRMVELTKKWALVTTGPASFISFEPGKRGRSTALQAIISSSLPPDDAEGHEVTKLLNAVLDAGENLYLRSNGAVGSVIITDTPAARILSVPQAVSGAKDTPQKLKMTPENLKNQVKSNSKAGDKNG